MPFHYQICSAIEFLGLKEKCLPTFLQAEAIINGVDHASSDNLGSYSDRETLNDACSLPFGASNREEAKAMVEGLKRVQGK